jgi:P4 family phage/plasmid primase-like protien
MTTPETNQYKDLNSFLKAYSISKTLSKEDKDEIEKTNTRIGCVDMNIYGGSYHIPEKEYDTFLQLYTQEVIIKNQPEYLTEKQIERGGPIVVDIDFRYEYKTEKRQYTVEHIQDLLSIYLEEFKRMFQLDESSQFLIFVMEKPTVKHIDEKQITKDGIHILFTLKLEHNAQLLLRDKILEKVPQIWGGFPTINSWDDVFDKGISTGKTNWQLFGSQKPGFDKYGLTQIYDIKYNVETEDFEFSERPLSTFKIPENIGLLSVRNKKLTECFMKQRFIQELETYKQKHRLSDAGGSTGGGSGVGVTKQQNVFTNNSSSSIDSRYIQIEGIRNRQDLDSAMENFIENARNCRELEMIDMYNYTNALPSPYYDSFDKWIRVGWALRNTHRKLLIVWIYFSAKSAKFDYNDIPKMCDNWMNDSSVNNKLTKRSLLFWARTDATAEYERIRLESADTLIEDTIDKASKKGGKCGDWDIANIMHHLYKNEFVCASIKGKIWYHYRENRWIETDSGTKLREKISKEIQKLYQEKSFALQGLMANTNEDDKDKMKSLGNRMNAIMNIMTHLVSTNDKNNYMTEAREHFYDETFLINMDNSPHLICFKNGVFDFEEKRFRKGYPEDYLSMSTNINYIEVTDKHQPIVDEINDFMRKLFPEPELCQYMWDHLASIMNGSSITQTFNMYTGKGRNGKSILVTFMEKVLGDYKCDVPLSMITEKRQKVGGVSPEIVQLKGKRYAVMQEPSKGDTINEGIMKQLTSGSDQLQGRAPYMPQTVSFTPQFKLALTCNNLMKVKTTDFGTWRRIRVVPFKSLFTENPVQGNPDQPYQFLLDENLGKTLDLWKEVFASMLIKRVCETNGLVKDCAIVTQESEKYQESENSISQYIRERILTNQEGYTITKPELSSDFDSWYKQTIGNGEKSRPNMKEVHEVMETKFGAMKDQKWYNLRIQYGSGGGGGGNGDCNIHDDNTDVDDITLEELQ